MQALKLFAALALAAAAPLFAQESFSVRVSLIVGSEALTSASLRSCLAKQLRELPGVIVSQEQRANYVVDVVPLTIKNKADRDLGVAASLVVYEVPRLTPGEPTPFPLDAIRPLIHIMTAGTLSQICSDMTAAIDQNAIEPAREAWQARQDLTRTPR
jgi:hypothetical protein